MIRGARWVDARTLEVNSEYYSADHIVIATGGWLAPNCPAQGGVTSDDFRA